MIYFFDIEKCKCCPYKDGCYKEGQKENIQRNLKSNAHSKQAEFQETEHFKEKMKERYKIDTTGNRGNIWTRCRSTA